MGNSNLGWCHLLWARQAQLAVRSVLRERGTAGTIFERAVRDGRESKM